MAEKELLVYHHGATLTNMLFMQEVKKVLELKSIRDSKTQCYFKLASALGLQYYYILNQGEQGYNHDGVQNRSKCS